MEPLLHSTLVVLFWIVLLKQCWIKCVRAFLYLVATIEIQTHIGFQITKMCQMKTFNSTYLNYGFLLLLNILHPPKYERRRREMLYRVSFDLCYEIFVQWNIKIASVPDAWKDYPLKVRSKYIKRRHVLIPQQIN